jgi:hypothetical protein
MTYKTTAVTMFFDLTKLKDKNSESRSASYYMPYGKPTLSIKNPMVIFCDETTKAQIQLIREEAVPDTALTIYIVKNITDYDLYKNNFDIVLENRKGLAHYVNSRNTPSYFILMMFKFEAMYLAKQLNPFQTQFYGWVDFGGSKILRSFSEKIPNILANPNPMITLCYIHYRGADELQDMKKFLNKGGPCGIAGGGFTVDANYMNHFYNGTLSIFHEMLVNGVGHSDEQVLTYFYHRYSNICTIYAGDYYSIATNYHTPREDYNSIRRYFINPCIIKGRLDLAKRAAEEVLTSVANNTLQISSDQKAELEGILKR